MIWWLILWLPLGVFWYLVLLIGSIIIHIWLAIKETCLFIVDDIKHRIGR